MSVIVALSGGKASAYCAHWALSNYPKQEVVLYFNDTKWEHVDLYRFLDDLAKYFKHEIMFDTDGRSPEELFYDNNALANNRMPFCSRILKAERLQKFYKHNDTLVFGISADEPQRAIRIVNVYNAVALQTKKDVKLIFPLIKEKVTKQDINKFLQAANIVEPLLYRLGFAHNNCSGGCVRAGKKHWKLLYEKLPEVYAERERVEREMREYTGKDISFFKDETLANFRVRLDQARLIDNLQTRMNFELEDEVETECIGICATTA